MPPKKKEGKAANGEVVEGEDPVQLLQNYQKYCKAIGIPINPLVGRTLNDEEKYPIDQLLIDDELGPLGPGGTRALMTAIMGSGPGMKGGPYKLLKSIRLWRTNCGDDGTAAISEVLRLGGAEVAISYLELLDCNIGPKGANGLGMALSYGNNVSLLTLKLDYNHTLGSDGIMYLCRGLRTNISLKQLHLQFCNLTAEAGIHLSDLLANSRSTLELLNISGNRLTGKGLFDLCKGLNMNTKCETLLIADNMIDQTEEDLVGLQAFRDTLNNPSVNLTAIDLMYNRIGEEGAKILAEAITPENSKVREFLVDLTLPMPLFEQLFRKAGAKKGGKGKKKKK